MATNGLRRCYPIVFNGTNLKGEEIWIRIPICIKVKAGSGSSSASKSNSGACGCSKMETQRVCCRPVITDLHQFNEARDPVQVKKSRIQIIIKMKSRTHPMSAFINIWPRVRRGSADGAVSSSNPLVKLVIKTCINIRPLGRDSR